MARAVTETRRIDGMLASKQFAQHPIFYFDLGPVLERSGSSLIRNAEGLEVLCRHGLGSLGDTDITLFERSGFYLVVGSCGGAQAEALANRVNVALLKLFFGTESLVPEQLKVLFRIALPGEISRGQSAALLETAAKIVDGGAGPPARKAASGDGFETARQRFAEIAQRGAFPAAQASLCFVPAYDLRRHTPVMFLCIPMAQREHQLVYGRSAFGDIDPEQMPFLDEAILRYAANFAAQLRASGSAVAVTAPVSMETLGWSRGRSLYQKALQHAAVAGQSDVIPTIDDVATGARPMRLAEMIGAIRVYAGRVAVSLPSADAIPDGCGQIGAAGFILALPRRCDAAMITRTAQQLSRLCITQSALSCLTDVNSEDALETAREAGIRLCAGAALAPRALPGEMALEYAKLLLRMPAGIEAAKPA